MEKNADRQIRPESVHTAVPTFWRQWLVAAMLMAFLWLTYGWFTRLETIVFQFLVLVSLGLLAVSLFRRSTTPQFRWAVVSLAGLALVFMSQTVEIGEIQKSKKNKSREYFRIGYMYGDLNVSYTEETKRTQEDCDDGQVHTYTDRKDIQITQTKGLGAELKVEKPLMDGSERIFGIGMYGNSYKKIIDGDVKTRNSFSSFAWLGKENKISSWQLGFHLGNLNYIGSYKVREKSDTESLESREGEFFMFPIFHFRVGNRYKFYGEIGCGDDLPYGITVSRFRGGVGIGNELFGLDYPFRVTGGAMQYIDKLAFYVDSEIGMGEKLFLAPAVRFGEHPLVSVGLGLKF